MSFYVENEEKVKKIIPIEESFSFIENPFVLYAYLKKIWSKESCALRMQDKWKEDNPSLGQCSITSFLAQDIFGGEVYGIPLKEGGVHCFNVVNDCIFDLTSEQFSNALEYTLDYPQCRDIHFEKDEKYMRYRYLKKKLKEARKNNG
ncbi:MAG: hypothetical protein IJ875_05270 [Solobacterium sp.]|nr:hypothetical protein [Solobacterium sp.]